MKEPRNNELCVQSLRETLALTPPRSTPSPSLKTSVKRRRESSVSAAEEYEIEEIVGYHIDKKKRMWYFVKWKGFSSKYNTFELIENLTGCNYLLMKYFEVKKPSEGLIKAKYAEVKKSLTNHKAYKELVENKYGQQHLQQFSENCMDISKIFDNSQFKWFKKRIEREFEYILRCLIAMQCHQDPGLFLRAQNYLICLNLMKLREEQLFRNLKAENHINELEKTLVKIENNVDLDSFPENLIYIVENKVGENISIPKDPILGCSCKGICSSKTKCCGKLAGFELAYNSKGRLRFLQPFPIYECNRRCSCDRDCPNRVVQNGRKVELCIFKTKSCGWGVKALRNIPAGEFVCEYLGEIISDSEAVVRDVYYFKNQLSYMFDLDFYQDSEYCVDGTNYGNIARFINHSCDPNLFVCPVWIDCLEPSFHRLAFFTRRKISPGEELFIDYENVGEKHSEQSDEKDAAGSKVRVKNITRIKCKCESDNCRQWVFGSE